jgi:hypothetical protein
MGNQESLFVAGRPMAPFKAPFCAEDKTIAAQRFEDARASKAVYKHCTFVNVSFKDAVLEEGKFLDCIFVECYFRRANLNDCSFVGSRFIDCRFPHVAVRSCDFRYVTFSGCAIDSKELIYSMPSQENLREELSRNLSVEAGRLGLSQESGVYREIEIRAREKHLWAAVQAESQWYRDHFDAFARARALFEYGLSLLNRWMLGYGVRPFILVRNWTFACVLVFPTLYWIFGRQFYAPEGSITFVSTLLFSLKNSVPAAIPSGLAPTGFLTILLALMQAIYSGVTVAFLASHIFRWSIQR